MNRAGLDLIGADSLYQVKGNCVYPMVCEEYREAFKAVTQDVFKGESRTLEFKMIALNGRPLWLYTHVVPLRNEKGEIVSALASTINITERKQAEIALKKSEARLQSILRAVPVGIGVVVNRVLIEVNSHLCEMTGRSRDELIGKSARVLYPTQEDFEFVGREKYRQIAEHGIGTVETRWIRKDGSILNVSLSSNPINPEDLSAGVTFTAIDITEHKQAEEILSKANARMLTLLDSMDAVVYVADMETSELLFMNKYGREIVGDYAGRKCWEVLQAGQQGQCPFCTNDRLRTGEGMPKGVYTWEFQNTKSGNWYECRDQIIQWTDGRMVRLEIAQDITERKQALEEKLRFANALEASLNEIYMFDAATLYFTYVNYGALINLGYAYEEITRLTPLDLKPDYDLEAFERLIGPLREGKQSFITFETRHQRKGGSFYPVEVHLQYFPPDRGGYFLAVIFDITGRKQAEEALQESEALYRNLFENHAAVKLVIEPDTGQIVDANDAAVRFYGWPRAEFKQMRIQEINTLPPEEIRKEMEKAGTQKRIHFEFRHRRADGSVRDVEVFSSKIEAKGKAFLHSIVHDITERKQAEKKLARSEAEFRRLSQEFHALLDAIPDRLTLKDKNMKILWANKGAAKSVGKEPEDLVGRYCYTLWQNRSRPCEACPVVVSFQSGGPAAGTVASPDGRVWDLRTIPLSDEEGNVVNVIEVGRDITEHRKLEEQLLQSQKLEAIGTLAGGVAHDFNNILSAIVGYAQLALMMLNDADPIKHNLEQILEASNRATVLTQSLLSFSRKQLVNLQLLDLNDLIRQFEKFLKRLIREDIELKILYAGEPLSISADIRQIEQVLMNLATNARDAMPKGGKLIIETGLAELDKEFVEAYGYGTPGQYAVISVSDTGTGMDEKTKKKIFEPFFTTKEEGKGTGLGLSMIYGIVKKHNGFINVYSEPGSGTTFRIYLPVARAQAETKAEARDAVEVRGGTETILIAEDDVPLRKLSRTLLEHFGYTVIEAVNGEDAINKFIEHKGAIHLALLDGIMPKKNGKEVYDVFRVLNPDIRVIFLTGYSEEIFSKEGIEDTERVRFIIKPVSLNVLLRNIREILDR